ncbi:MAG: hypothetical protein M1831_002963 [Alyxoria varia]|nr:MAG: hypothetical protein M1831_002963 [Alyxoria varia]
MGAGLTRLIEISFILRDKQSLSMDGNEPNSFQYVPVFLLYASGFLFMGATEEQMTLLASAHVTHVSYILILYSIAFMLFLFVNMLLHLYAINAQPASSKPSTGQSDGAYGGRADNSLFGDDDSSTDVEPGLTDARAKQGVMPDEERNGSIRPGMLSDRERRQMRDAQEFELDALIASDDESEDGHEKHRSRSKGDRARKEVGERQEEEGESSRGSSDQANSQKEQGMVRL